jgi:signal peptidase I
MMRYIVFRKNKLQKIRPYISLVVVTALIALIVMTFILDIYRIPTESMEPTLLPGDHVVGLKIVYGIRIPFTDIHIKISGPKHSDVVSIKRPEDNILYIKRVVALPTESVELRSGNITVSGQVFKRDYATDTSMYKYADANDVVFEEFAWNKKYYVSYSNQKRISDMDKIRVCSSDGFFVMGDNRTNSVDSRKWGDVRGRDIVSRVVFIFFSTDPDTGKIRWGRVGIIH